MEFQVLKKSHLKRNIIIGVVVIAIITAVVLQFTIAKYRTAESIPLINGTVNYSLADLNIVAIYVSGEAVDSLDSSKQYTLDTTQSTCAYKDGSTIDGLNISYETETGSLSISPFTAKGTKCTLYFDEELLPATDIIEGLYPDNQDMLAYDDYENLRYIGADPNNYVYFNCSDYANSSNSTCELWRIIGVFSEDTHGISGQKLIKLIRSESLGSIAWDSANTNNWSTASLQITLNDDYLNGSDTYVSTGIKNDITRNLIETVTWKLGGSSTYDDVTASMFYERERGTTVYSGRPTTWSGKVALMYPSDYGYATSGGATTNREACLAVTLYNWSSYSDCYNNDWLFNGASSQWTLTSGSIGSSYVFTVYNTGIISNGYINANLTFFRARPTVYLKSNIAISGGTGTSSDPYQLSVG